MKFCGKCHKMVVKKVTNPNNIHRICICGLSNSEIFITGDVLPKMRSEAHDGSSTTRNSRGKYLRAIRDFESNPVYVNE